LDAIDGRERQGSLKAAFLYVGNGETMKNRINQFLNEARCNLRVRENSRVLWCIKERKVKGLGKVRNISRTGMLLETNSSIKPQAGHLFSFDSDLGQGNFIPQNGRLVWHKKKPSLNDRYLCGIEFVNPAEYVSNRLHQRVQKKIVHFTNLKKVKNCLSVLLFSGLVALTGFVLYTSQQIFQTMRDTNKNMISAAGGQAALTRNYTNLYHDTEMKLVSTLVELDSTKNLYQESQTMLGSANGELQSAKEILVQTEAMLARFKQNNIGLQGEFNSFKSSSEQQLALLEEKNTRLASELDVLNDRVKYYEGGVKNFDEGRMLLINYRDKMKLVKSKIREFRREAGHFRSLALREMDRIKMELGNNGYFVKDGKDVKVDIESYEALRLDSAKSSRQVEIDVNNFQ